MMPYVYYEMEATPDQKKTGAMFHPLNFRPDMQSSRLKLMTIQAVIIYAPQSCNVE